MKQIRIECSSSLGGGIRLHAVLKELPDDKHYHISKTVYPNHGTFKLTESDCRYAAVFLMQLLESPLMLISQTGSYEFNKGCDRGVLLTKHLTEQHNPMTILVDFDHAEELYTRLLEYDLSMERLKAEYGV